jgi:peptide/nickel transport system permease protein
MSQLNSERAQSPLSLAFGRVKGDSASMVSLSIIALCVLVALGCYLLAPDNSPSANRMNITCAMQAPGTRITYLIVPDKQVEHTSWLESCVSGFSPEGKWVPVQDWTLGLDSVRYTMYSGDPDWPGESEALHRKAWPTFRDKEDFSARWIVSQTHWLGTDRYGRDLLSRMLVAARVSVSVGFIAVGISLLIGVMLGAIAGYYRGTADKIIQWFINVVWSIPTLLLVVAITLALGKGLVQVFVAVGLTMWVEVARIVRGQVFSLREQQYIEAGKALGFSNARIILRHVLPNVAGPVIVVAASNFASAILLEAGLSFLGLGVQPPAPSWGMMIKENYSAIVIGAPWLAVVPGTAIAVLVLSFTLLGNGLRDAFDTRA